MLTLLLQCTAVIVSLVTQVKTLTLIEGDGIGPEISNAVIKIFAAADVSYWYLTNHQNFEDKQVTSCT